VTPVDAQPFRILSLDGGIKGAFAALVLATFERVTGGGSSSF
jgi:hypothetical protein